eukprot:7759900-Pyramimonas_sp.AAC.1
MAITQDWIDYFCGEPIVPHVPFNASTPWTTLEQQNYADLRNSLMYNVNLQDLDANDRRQEQMNPLAQQEGLPEEEAIRIVTDEHHHDQNQMDERSGED